MYRLETMKIYYRDHKNYSRCSLSLSYTHHWSFESHYKSSVYLIVAFAITKDIGARRGRTSKVLLNSSLHPLQSIGIYSSQMEVFRNRNGYCYVLCWNVAFHCTSTHPYPPAHRLTQACFSTDKEYTVDGSDDRKQ